MSEFEPPPASAASVPAADVQASSAGDYALVHQAFPVKQPDVDANEFLVRVRASTLQRCRARLQQLSVLRFPWHEVALGLSTLAGGGFLGALPAGLEPGSMSGVFFYTFLPVVAVGSGVTYLLLRARTTSDAASTAHDVLDDPRSGSREVEMNLNDLSTQLLFTTLPIWSEKADGSVSSATAFLYNVPAPMQEGQSIPFLVTNRHVVLGAKRAVVELIEREGDLPATDRRVRAEIDAATLIARTSEPLDVAIVPIGPLLNQLEQAGKPVFFRSVTPDLIPTDEALSDLAALEEIVFIGYPSGMRDEKHGTPLIRRGITATPVWNDYQGRPSFLVDAGVFPGSSGSPLFVLNQGSYPTRDALVVGTRLLFLGLVTDTIVRSGSGAEIYLGLGRATRSSALKAFVDEIARTIA